MLKRAHLDSVYDINGASVPANAGIPHAVSDDPTHDLSRPLAVKRTDRKRGNDLWTEKQDGQKAMLKLHAATSRPRLSHRHVLDAKRAEIGDLVIPIRSIAHIDQ